MINSINIFLYDSGAYKGRQILKEDEGKLFQNTFVALSEIIADKNNSKWSSHRISIYEGKHSDTFYITINAIAKETGALSEKLFHEQYKKKYLQEIARYPEKSPNLIISMVICLITLTQQVFERTKYKNMELKDINCMVNMSSNGKFDASNMKAWFK